MGTATDKYIALRRGLALELGGDPDQAHEVSDEQMLCGVRRAVEAESTMGAMQGRLEELAARLEQAHAAKTQAEEAELAAAQDLDALAAYVERGRAIVRGWGDGKYSDAVAAAKLAMWKQDAPTTYFARLKAEIRWHEADLAVVTLRSSEGRQKAMDALRSRAEHLRRQAEGGEV